MNDGNENAEILRLYWIIIIILKSRIKVTKICLVIYHSLRYLWTGKFPVFQFFGLEEKAQL